MVLVGPGQRLPSMIPISTVAAEFVLSVYKAAYAVLEKYESFIRYHAKVWPLRTIPKTYLCLIFS